MDHPAHAFEIANLGLVESPGSIESLGGGNPADEWTRLRNCRALKCICDQHGPVSEVCVQLCAQPHREGDRWGICMIHQDEAHGYTQRRLDNKNFPMSNHKEQHRQLENNGEWPKLFHVITQVAKSEFCQRVNVA